MKLSLDQFDRLKAVLGNVDLADADEPAFELDAVDLSDDFPTGTILVTKRRTGERRNATVGHIAPDGTFTEPPESDPTLIPKDVKAKLLRVGYQVWAEGAPEPSRIMLVERHEGGTVVVGVDWGQIHYHREELVPALVETLHPRIVDPEGVEIGLGSMVSDGSDGDSGEVVGFREPDESHWKIVVNWPDHGEETFSAIPRDQSEDPLVVNDVTAQS